MTIDNTTVVAIGAIIISLYNSYNAARAADAIRKVAEALVEHAAEKVRSQEPKEFP